MRIQLSIVSFTFLIMGWACQPKEMDERVYTGDLLIDANEQLTQVIVHDIFSPPVASRIYAYPSIAAYEVAAMADPSLQSLAGQLNGFEEKTYDVPEDVFYPLAALTAYYQVATALVFSEDQLENHQKELLKSFRSALSTKAYSNSIDLGKEVAAHVLDYSKGDNYHQSRSFEKYGLTGIEGTWQPTPPAYMEGIEPHWNKIRPFFLDSAAQFKSTPPTAYSKDPESQFYKEAYEVFNVHQTMTDEQKDIAFFWDCNPYKMNIKGHVMFAEKKITPGGHWMGIAGIAAKKAQLDWKGTAEAMAYTAITLMDGFIACWDEKYRSVLVRPETFINQHIDEDWVPLLQTPPFPEYTSGHSVISTAAANTLTHLFGEPFEFVDSTEVAYGLPTRTFPSFRAAAEEAAISRLYGGIHYRPAITEGTKKGQKVGDHLLVKVKTRQENLAEKR
ncbi:vanadium-dependent haloperoxidase [Litoribacter alkaliphilus]|uniref:Vanadium-dependent haloperoxidase n=1 Tax=Litoribacter ruber TaxID=702568 RepID=A0AAP2G4Z1_9BACT|nr:vanadium-dependent haloperoxidase [Litoribacter alkaliphilus]MBS9523988.1 vanadium-dependent haloperoxidase [Litoribacter alkaliphilus]